MFTQCLFELPISLDCLDRDEAVIRILFQKQNVLYFYNSNQNKYTSVYEWFRKKLPNEIKFCQHLTLVGLKYNNYNSKIIDIRLRGKRFDWCNLSYNDLMLFGNNAVQSVIKFNHYSKIQDYQF